MLPEYVGQNSFCVEEKPLNADKCGRGDGCDLHSKDIQRLFMWPSIQLQVENTPVPKGNLEVNRRLKRAACFLLKAARGGPDNFTLQLTEMRSNSLKEYTNNVRALGTYCLGFERTFRVCISLIEFESIE